MKKMLAAALAASMVMGLTACGGSSQPTETKAPESAKEADFKVKFDPTLVRGQSYYTGTIFEVTMDEFGGSVAGGGRYDKMIGKFTGQNTSACGFSIGFERIVTILLDNGFTVPGGNEKEAWLFEKGMSSEKLASIMKVLPSARKKHIFLKRICTRKASSKYLRWQKLTAQPGNRFWWSI